MAQLAYPLPETPGYAEPADVEAILKSQSSELASHLESLYQGADPATQELRSAYFAELNNVVAEYNALYRHQQTMPTQVALEGFFSSAKKKIKGLFSGKKKKKEGEAPAAEAEAEEPKKEEKKKKKKKGIIKRFFGNYQDASGAIVAYDPSTDSEGERALSDSEAEGEVTTGDVGPLLVDLYKAHGNWLIKYFDLIHHLPKSDSRKKEHLQLLIDRLPVYERLLDKHGADSPELRNYLLGVGAEIYLLSEKYFPRSYPLALFVAIVNGLVAGRAKAAIESFTAENPEGTDGYADVHLLLFKNYDRFIMLEAKVGADSPKLRRFCCQVAKGILALTGDAAYDIDSEDEGSGPTVVELIERGVPDERQEEAKELVVELMEQVHRSTNGVTRRIRDKIAESQGKDPRWDKLVLIMRDGARKYKEAHGPRQVEAVVDEVARKIITLGADADAGNYLRHLMKKYPEVKAILRKARETGDEITRDQIGALLDKAAKEHARSKNPQAVDSETLVKIKMMAGEVREPAAFSAFLGASGLVGDGEHTKASGKRYLHHLIKKDPSIKEVLKRVQRSGDSSLREKVVQVADEAAERHGRTGNRKQVDADAIAELHEIGDSLGPGRSPKDGGLVFLAGSGSAKYSVPMPVSLEKKKKQRDGAGLIFLDDPNASKASKSSRPSRSTRLKQLVFASYPELETLYDELKAKDEAADLHDFEEIVSDVAIAFLDLDAEAAAAAADVLRNRFNVRESAKPGAEGSRTELPFAWRTPLAARTLVPDGASGSEWLQSRADLDAAANLDRNIFKTIGEKLNKTKRQAKRGLRIATNDVLLTGMPARGGSAPAHLKPFIDFIGANESSYDLVRDRADIGKTFDLAASKISQAVVSLVVDDADATEHLLNRKSVTMRELVPIAGGALELYVGGAINVIDLTSLKREVRRGELVSSDGKRGASFELKVKDGSRTVISHHFRVDSVNKEDELWFTSTRTASDDNYVVLRFANPTADPTLLAIYVIYPPRTSTAVTFKSSTPFQTAMESGAVAIASLVRASLANSVARTSLESSLHRYARRAAQLSEKPALSCVNEVLATAVGLGSLPKLDELQRKAATSNTLTGTALETSASEASAALDKRVDTAFAALRAEAHASGKTVASLASAILADLKVEMTRNPVETTEMLSKMLHANAARIESFADAKGRTELLWSLAATDFATALDNFIY